ncbi:hypothetical protein [Saccharopolyspora phatthalungensis]|uniref:hypothetical protein n=1 Tax=Saccharopolyspora phatthalungensis TaxID=664693 RepID=UPI001C870814|nr:hypothetical protein [Saccharopolyspora phatthalungensis]
MKDEEGLTWRQLVDRAVSKGEAAPTSIFHLGNPDRPMQDFPRTKTILGLAAALGVAPGVVADAALESLNLRRPDVVEVEAKDVQVHSGDNEGQSHAHSSERWIMIVPDDSTPDDVLNACETAANLRVRLPNGETKRPSNVG